MGHKVKQSLVNSRIDFFYYAFRNIILASTIVLTLAVIALGISRTSAYNNSSDRVSVSVPVSCTLTSHINSGEEHTISMVSGTYEDDIGITTFTTSCNDPNGFVIYANGNTDDVEGNNKLTSILGSTYDIPSGTATSGDTSQWAMKLTAINAIAPSDTPTIVPGYDAYSAIPTSWTKVAYKGAGTTNMDIGSSFTTTYAIYLKGTQPASTYSGQVKYIMLHPSTVAQPTDTIEHAFALAGKSKVQVTDPITGQSGSFYKIQDMTTNICESTTLVDEQNTLQLVDIRDNKLYWVTKLRDGHCWMTQNLDLDLGIKDTSLGIDTTVLTSEDTDLSDNSLMGAYKDGYKYENRVLSWTPVNGTISFAGTTVTGWWNSNTAPYSANKTDDTETGHNSLGNYYNWTAAIASNNSSSLTQDTLSDISKNPKNSICPKGWRLPTISNQSETLPSSTNEFARLNYLYNTIGGTNSDYLEQNPLLFVKGGRLSPNLSYYLGDGYYWTSTVNGVSNSYNLYFENGVNQTSNQRQRGWGFLIRCVVK